MSMLRTFEAAARLTGFSAAAKELCITHSAVSQRIRLLEGRLGYPLFYRSGNAMLLTEAGQRLACQVRQTLDGLEQIFPSDPEPGAAEDRLLRLQVMAPIAENWLIPRLQEFKQCHPGISLDIRTTPDLVAPDDQAVDMSLRYGDGNWRGVEQLKLLDEQVFPACSPGFLHAHPDISLHNLKRLPLLRHSLLSWRPWFEQAGLAPEEPDNSLAFNEFTHTIQAALVGQGIALARGLLVEDHLRSGRLVRLFDISAPGAFSYYLVWRRNPRKEAVMSLFRDWVVAALADGGGA